MSVINEIWNALGDFFNYIGKIVSEIIKGVISLFSHVVSYFRGLKLRKGRDTPFIARREKIAELIHNAPVKEIGIFEATYNEDTNEIENYKMIEGDSIDSNLNNVLGNETLVVLT